MSVLHSECASIHLAPPSPGFWQRPKQPRQSCAPSVHELPTVPTLYSEAHVLSAPRCGRYMSLHTNGNQLCSGPVHPDRRTLCKLLLGRDDAADIARFLQELHTLGSFDAALKCSQHVAGALVIVAAAGPSHMPVQPRLARFSLASLAAWQAPTTSGERTRDSGG